MDIFKTKYNTVICNQDVITYDFPYITERFKTNIAQTLRDFRVMLSAKKIVISQSTFYWWGVWLSDANEVYYPICNTGFWNGQMDINLKVNDEDLYIFIES